MPKGYWIPHIDVKNPEGYKGYTAATPEAHRKYSGHALVRGGAYQVLEGKARSRNVLREFNSYDDALACYRSPEYQAAKPLRLANGDSDFVIVEGYDGPQPAPIGTPPAAAARKGYWIGHVDVSDPEKYKPYTIANAVPFGMFGARFLVRGGRHEVTEGHARARTVVMEFPSYEAALACYRSPEYQAAAALRKGAAEIDLVAVEGYDGDPH
jgi:uncharacterized protein (DUF1330 family)